MATSRKKTTSRTYRRSSAPNLQSSMSEYMPSYSGKGTSPLLVILVIVLVFFTGYLFFKVKKLEKSGETAGNVVQQVGQQQPAPGTKVNVDPGHLPVLGNKNAPVTVIEFGDFRCPFCEKLFTDVEPNLKKDYIDTGKVKFYFRHYAFLGPASTVAANAAECANEQGKFWGMHDYLFQHQPNESDTSMYTTDNMTSAAGQLGMNTSQFQNCLDGKKYDKNVTDDLNAGQKVGVQGTPSTFVNGVMIDGAQPYSVFKAAIDKELSK